MFGSVDLESDEFQSLDLRFVPAGGIGYHTIVSEATHLDPGVVASGTREFFSTGLSRTSAEVLVSELLIHNVSKASSIQEKLVCFSNVSDAANYRINFDTTLSTAIRRWMSWQLTISDRHVSNPLASRKTNDLLVSTGLRLTLKG